MNLLVCSRPLKQKCHDARSKNATTHTLTARPQSLIGLTETDLGCVKT
jgi:hypothetical protein